MKYLIVIFSLLAGVNLYADSAPYAEIPGGNVIPISNNDIQLSEETINITLLPSCYKVEVIYTFINHGIDQIVKMGFPISDIGSTRDFQAFESNKSLKTTIKKGYWDFSFPKYLTCCETPDTFINAFSCFDVHFQLGETKIIKNTYSQIYTEADLDYYFYYILKTGSLWKDKIKSIQVNINSEKVPNHFNLLNGSFNNTKTSLINFTQKFENIKPSTDLFFSFKIRDYFCVTKASSELKSSFNNNYFAINVEDNNPTTAWIEGNEGYGIGESISFYTSMGGNQGVAFTIDSIGIINGYAKNLNTYLNNSRVKQFIITTNVDNDWELDYNQEKKVVINLKDTLEIQYLKFNPPLHATDIKFTIKDIYKGLKYNDTGISDIYFYLKENK